MVSHIICTKGRSFYLMLTFFWIAEKNSGWSKRMEILMIIIIVIMNRKQKLWGERPRGFVCAFICVPVVHVGIIFLAKVIVPILNVFFIHYLLPSSSYLIPRGKEKDTVVGRPNRHTKCALMMSFDIRYYTKKWKKCEWSFMYCNKINSWVVEQGA